MDVCSALMLLPLQPPVLSSETISQAGPYQPVQCVPSWLPPASLAQLSQHEDLQSSVALSFAILAADHQRAADVLRHDPLLLQRTPKLRQRLQPWADQAVRDLRQQSQEKLKLFTGDLVILAAHRQMAERFQLVTTTLDGFIPALEQATWLGPVVVRTAPNSPAEILAARPWAPVLLVPDHADRATCGRMLTELRLRLLESPTHPWPAWLQAGILGCAAIRADKLPPSPQAMRARRRQAGSQAIAACLNSKVPDQELATALATPLLHSHRQQQLPRFLDLVRLGTPSAEALQFVYGWSVNDLVQLQR